MLSWEFEGNDKSNKGKRVHSRLVETENGEKTRKNIKLLHIKESILRENNGEEPRS